MKINKNQVNFGSVLNWCCPKQLTWFKSLWINFGSVLNWCCPKLYKKLLENHLNFGSVLNWCCPKRSIDLNKS
ncbi:MAG: hypothetical protein ACRCW6_01160 [Mycoplasmoidaceae bacterium]